MSIVSEKLAEIRERIAVAAARSGRTADAVRLIAVTKYAAANERFLPDLLEAGCFDFGEARVQSLLEKAELFREESRIRWHMIGPLQRNKVRRILSVCELIHSVDSLSLLEAIDRIAQEEALSVFPKILLEVNISGETSKQGFDPERLPEILERIEAFRHVRVLGLMGMSGLESGLDQKRREFASLRRLAESLRDRVPENVVLRELSIGMSEDFEIAIEEGATIVRIGSSLYDTTL